MLALSTFRKSPKAVDLALSEAAEYGKMLVVFVVDVNLARYMIGSDIGMVPGLQNKYETQVLEEHRQQAEAEVRAITAMAAARGLRTETHIVTGRFGIECTQIARHARPVLVVTTRSNRPAWVRRFFGSPVDYLIANAGCPVLEA